MASERKTAAEGFLDVYLRFTSGQESPVIFHRWAAISITAAMIGRKLWMNRGYYILFPNHYIFLVGASGKEKKDTVCDIGVDLMKLCPNCASFFPGQISGSALLGHLHQLGNRKADDGTRLDASLYIVAPEFSAFVGQHPMNEPTIVNLTALYKSPDLWPYITRKHGEEHLRNVCINMLSGSNIKWLRNAIPESAIGGGFTGRNIIVFSDADPQRIANPKPPPDEKQIRSALVYDLSAIGMMHGEMKATETAQEFMVHWYEKSGAMDYSDEDVLGPYLERKMDHVWKLAMILSTMDDGQKVVDVTHCRRALEYLEQLEGGARIVLTAIEASEDSLVTKKILEVIRRAGKISRVTLQRRVVRYANKEILDRALATLDGTFIQTYMGGPTKKQVWYRPIQGIEGEF